MNRPRPRPRPPLTMVFLVLVAALAVVGAGCGSAGGSAVASVGAAVLSQEELEAIVEGAGAENTSVVSREVAAGHMAEWIFYESWIDLAAEGDGTRVRQTVQLGPGPSGLTRRIDELPDRRDDIIAARTGEHRRNMQATLEGLKSAAERDG